jgi:hypothetical protein
VNAFDRPELRASDADRDRVAEQLREAFAEGRLTAEEHAERLEAVYEAKTHGQLAPLTSDLPVRADSAAPVAAEPSDAEPGTLSRYSQPLVAVFGNVQRSGRWMVPNGMVATAVFGEVVLDLREAVLERREIIVTANAIFGQVVLKVPEGVVVLDEGVAIFGNRSTHQPRETPVAGAPTIRVKGASVFGQLDVQYRKR